MKYLNEANIQEIGLDWDKTINVIEEAIVKISEKKYDQPIKPYLKFENPKNRIIAMPAYISGEKKSCGIKWVASFPDNINNNLKRAHSLTILNDASTGVPKSIINTALVSGIRTASVSGFMVKEYKKNKMNSKFNVGILGFGPIGQLHLKMIFSVLGESLNKVKIFDIREVDLSNIPFDYKNKIEVVNDYKECMHQTDIFITCTVSSKGYIKEKPKKGSLVLNVSLREFSVDILQYNPLIIVDDWKEVAREGTDIEYMKLEKNLTESDVLTLSNVLNENILENNAERTIMFNPMGMAVFDIAIAQYYFEKSELLNVGLHIPD